MNSGIDIYFSDYFHVSPEILEEYGAFNISLINDLPVFIDPFLLFNSDDTVYNKLHTNIIEYLKFLRLRSSRGNVSKGILDALYRFPEVKQIWLGFSHNGNQGSGLGPKFADSLNNNLNTIFSSFGDERITKASHLEKLCLIEGRVGKDNISDFTANLIKDFLASYTQDFAKKHLNPNYCMRCSVPRVTFSYETYTWKQGVYYLPVYDNDYVLLTPKDILTKEQTWINRADMLDRLMDIAESLPNHALREQLNEYLAEKLRGVESKEGRLKVFANTLHSFPELVDYYIRNQEENGDKAVDISKSRVRRTESLFILQVRDFVDNYLAGSSFYEVTGDTLEEARSRVLYLKQVIEDNDGYKFFYVDGMPIRREQDIQLLFKLTWCGTRSDVNREANNGRGPVDYKISRGSCDMSLVEFKLASNSKLKKNLQNQVEIYEKANQTKKSLKVILYFSEKEEQTVVAILRSLKLEDNPNIILIDARNDNKPSASVA